MLETDLDAHTFRTNLPCCRCSANAVAEFARNMTATSLAFYHYAFVGSHDATSPAVHRNMYQVPDK